MSLAITPLHPLFAARVEDLDLRTPLTADLARTIEHAMDQYAVLVFPGQRLEEEHQLAFARAFGPLDLGLKKTGIRDNRFKYAESIDISNVAPDGRIADPGSRKMASQLANQLWHSDSSFQHPAARYSTLYSIVNPPSGGETEFTDLRAAYDTLSADLKATIADLESEHYALYSRINLGVSDYTEAEKKAIPPARWPLVRTHPGSGRSLLWVGIHATQIFGMSLPEGRVLLADLLEHATQRELVYRHSWQVGDLVMWDNRATLHRGRRYDLTARRELRRVSTEDQPSVAVATAPAH
jgi:alpha-ketoglutarate-dependent 2,4-dichlorophenoxyacetate dioxygenase